MDYSLLSTKPVKIEHLNANDKTLKHSFSRGASKARASIVSIEFRNHRNNSIPKDTNMLLNTSAGNTSDLSGSKENLSDVNSFEDFVKFSYDQNTNEIIGSSLKQSSITDANNNSSGMRMAAYRFRSQSFGLLSLSNEGELFDKI